MLNFQQGNKLTGCCAILSIHPALTFVSAFVSFLIQVDIMEPKDEELPKEPRSISKARPEAATATA